MKRSRAGLWIVLASLSVVAPEAARAQAAKTVPAAPPPVATSTEQPNAQLTREQFLELLRGYPPALRSVLALDASLLTNPSYLAPYPALAAFLSTHPEIARNPSFYVGQGPGPIHSQDRSERVLQMWDDLMKGVLIFSVFGLVIGLIVWLIRTLIDYRRWSRLAKVQTDVHTKILERFSSNEDMLAYIQSPAGSSFLQSTPIRLDAGPRGVSAPLGRILWSLQGGLVLMAAGIGFLVVAARVTEEASQPLQAVGVLGIALGLGFVVSAIISYVISRKLGLIETALPPRP